MTFGWRTSLIKGSLLSGKRVGGNQETQEVTTPAHCTLRGTGEKGNIEEKTEDRDKNKN